MSIDITYLLALRSEIKNLESAYIFHKKVPLNDEYKNLPMEISILKSLKSNLKKLKDIEDNTVMLMGILTIPCLDEKINILDNQIKFLEGRE